MDRADLDAWALTALAVLAGSIAVGLLVWFRLGVLLALHTQGRPARWILPALGMGLVIGLLQVLSVSVHVVSESPEVGDLAWLGAQGAWIAMLLGVGAGASAVRAESEG